MAAGRSTAGARAATLRRHGSRLIAGGAGLFAGYCLLVWFGVFGHDDDAPVCFGIPHHDWFFPPATVCSPDDGRTIIATSQLTTAAGMVLFLLASGLLVGGLTLLRRSRRVAHRAPGARPSRRTPGVPWSPGAHGLPHSFGSTRSLTPTAEPRTAHETSGGRSR